jgi:hypothetical protein
LSVQAEDTIMAQKRGEFRFFLSLTMIQSIKKGLKMQVQDDASEADCFVVLQRQ